MRQSMQAIVIAGSCGIGVTRMLACAAQESAPPYQGANAATGMVSTTTGDMAATDMTATAADTTSVADTTATTDTTTTTSAGGATATTTTTATGGATSAAGAASTAPPEKYCVSKVTVATPLITDWETYDGMADVTEWAFGYDTEDAGVIRGGAFPMEDTSGTYEMLMLAGYNSNFALTIRNTMADNWSAWGMWFDSSSDCLDAKAYSGISFWVRGEVPENGSAGIQLGMEGTTSPSEEDPLAGGTCESTVDGECAPASAEFAVTLDWTQIQIPWTGFTDGVGAGGVAVAVNGDEIVGINFFVTPEWVPVVPDDYEGDYEPVPAAMELQIDDLGFY